MELDRQSIVRRDFPLERRGGYSRTAVDAHLEAIATALAALEAAHAGQTASAAVSAQVASIVSAAEQAAKRIEREAVERAREHDARVAAAATALLERIDALRAGVEQLPGGLAAVRREEAARLASNGAVSRAAAEPEVAELSDAAADAAAGADAAPLFVEAVDEVVPDPVVEREAVVAEADEVVSEGDEAVAEGDEVVAVRDEVVAELPPAPKSATAPRSTAVEDARFVALEMLLEGRSRGEVDAFLAENFDLPDRAALLDEVATAAGV
jgi:hypothetical protein